MASGHDPCVGFADWPAPAYRCVLAARQECHSGLGRIDGKAVENRACLSFQIAQPNAYSCWVRVEELSPAKPSHTSLIFAPPLTSPPVAIHPAARPFITVLIAFHIPLPLYNTLLGRATADIPLPLLGHTLRRAGGGYAFFVRTPKCTALTRLRHSDTRWRTPSAARTRNPAATFKTILALRTIMPCTRATTTEVD